MTTMNDQLTNAEFSALLQHAAKLIRLRPVTGADPCEAAEWRGRAQEFLDRPDVAQALAQSGGKPAGGSGEPPVDLADLLDQLAQKVGSHEDVIPIVVGGIFAAYIALVAYAIYENATATGESPDGGAPDGGSS